MKNLDLTLKRILIISLSISFVLLSASLLMFAAKPANAQVPSSFSNPSQIYDGRMYDAVAGHTTTGREVFLLWNTQTGAHRIIDSRTDSKTSW